MNNHDNTNQDDDFHQACRLAVETKRPLHLTVSFLRMEETIVLRRQEKLTIVGYHENGDDNDHSEKEEKQRTTTTTLQGNLHSLFVLNNFSQLNLQHISLKHTLEPTAVSGAGDHRQVGAAINLRKKSRLVMKVGHLHSTCGFCLWIVQKSNVTLQDCQLQAILRSPLVCFGQPTVHLKNCQIVDAGVHALCARGECQIQLEDCHIAGSASRAIYAYAQASMTLVRTIVTGTVRHDKAAIEVSAASGGDDTKQNANAPTKQSKKGKSGHVKIPPKSTLIMTDCKVCDNQGIGILIRGDVDCALSNTEYSGNAKDNFVETTALQDDDAQPPEAPLHGSKASNSASTTAEDASILIVDGHSRPSTISGLKRDPSGSSSFRQGDWWCPKCYQDWYYHHYHSKTSLRNPVIVMAGMKECPTCGFASCKHDDDSNTLSEFVLGLTVAEIAGLNRGKPIAIREQLLQLKEQNQTNREEAKHHQWMFDGDDKGWIPYDAASNVLLEEAFQKHNKLRIHEDETALPIPHNDQESSRPDDEDEEDAEIKVSADDGLLVTLCQGRYQVDLEKMEQVNLESQMLRFVKRIEIAAAEKSSN